MNWQQQNIRRKVFISYHRADSNEVFNFIKLFSGAYDTFLARGIGSGGWRCKFRSKSEPYSGVKVSQ